MYKTIFLRVVGLCLSVLALSVNSANSYQPNNEFLQGDYTNGAGQPYIGDGLVSWIDGLPYSMWKDSNDPNAVPSWNYERERRLKAIDSYLNESRAGQSKQWGFRQEGNQPQNSALAWKWFQESPVGFGGVPYVLLKTLIDLNDENCAVAGQYDICKLNGIWQKKPKLLTGLKSDALNLDHLGFGPHPDDYRNGTAISPQQRRWPLPYGFVFQSGDPKLPDDVSPFYEPIETLDKSTYVAGLIESRQLRKVRSSSSDGQPDIDSQIKALDIYLNRKIRLGKLSLGFAKLKDGFVQKNVLGLYGKKTDHAVPLSRFYEDDPNFFGRSTGMDRVFFSCAACHVGRVNTQEHGIVHLPGAPNTEVQAQYFSELLMDTGARLIKSGFDPTSGSLIKPDKIKPDTKLIVGLFKAMLHKAINNPQSLYGPSDEQILRGKFMAFRIAWNFPEVVQDLIGTAIKTHFVYRVVAGNNAYKHRNTQSAGTNQKLPALINYRIGQMDAFGIASGLAAIHTLRPDHSFMKFLFEDPLETLGNGTGRSSAFKGFTGFGENPIDSNDLGFDLKGLADDEQLKIAADRIFDQDNISRWAPPLPAPIDIKSMFFSRDRILANWDGNQAASARALASGTSATGDPRKVNVEIHEPLNPFINHLPPSPYLWNVDLNKAVKGRPIFEEKCAGCHKPNNRRIFSAKKLGVDTSRSLTNTTVSREILAGLVLESCNIYYENNPGKAGNDFCLPVGDTQADRLEDYFSDVPGRVKQGKNGYKADMLHGIWTRAPYLHNGSVPTLAALMCVEARPTTFLRGVLNYDTDLLGFEWQHAPQQRYNSVHEVVSFDVYDTSVVSRSNTGHEYGNFLCPKELRHLDPMKDREKMTELMLGKNRDTDLAYLLEYLKTL